MVMVCVSAAFGADSTPWLRIFSHSYITKDTPPPCPRRRVFVEALLLGPDSPPRLRFFFTRAAADSEMLKR
jgi:hypothetical protein